MTGKKRKGSIIRSVILMLAIMALLSTSVSAALSYYFNMDDVKKIAGHNAQTSADIITALMDTYSIDDARHRALLEQELLYLNKAYEFDSLIIFYIDENSGINVLVSTDPNASNDPETLASWRFHDFKDEASHRSVMLLDSNTEHTHFWRTNIGSEKYYVCQNPIYIDNSSFSNCYIGTIYSAETINNSIISEMLWFAIPSAVIVFVTLMVVLLFLNFNMLQPIRHIAGRMNHFTRNYGKEDNRIDIKHVNELGEIATAFNKMSEDIAVMICDINAMNEERLNERAQMNAAKSIQQGIVPRHTLIKQGDFEACAAIRLAKEVGGDFYDCYIREDGKLCMVVGDVSGKGVSAALFMIMVKSEIKTMLNSGMSPSEVLNKVNDELCIHNPEGMFATVFAAVYDPAARELCFANAGHNPPVLVGREPRIMQIDSGIALGLFQNSSLKDMHISLKAGEGILIYTDGVTEAVNEKGEWFGIDRLLCLPAGSAEQLISTLKADVDKHYNGREQFDDLAVLALTVNEDGCMLLPDSKSLNDIRNMLKRQFNGSIPKKIALACEEAFINIVSYSGADTIRLTLIQNGNTFTAEYSDNGIAFDPVNEYLPPKDPDDFDTGGMGITIMKKSVKNLSYERKDGQNILSMTFDTEGFTDAD